MGRFWKSRYTRPINTFVPLPLDYLRKVVDKENKGFADIKDAAGAIDTASLNYNDWSPNDVAGAQKFNADRMAYINGAIDAIDPTNLTQENWRNQKDKAAAYIMRAKRLNAEKNTQGTIPWQIEQNKKDYDKDEERILALPKYDETMKRNAIYETRQAYLANNGVGSNGQINSYNKYISGNYYDKDKLLSQMDRIKAETLGRSSHSSFDNEWLSTTYHETTTRKFADLLAKGQGLYSNNKELINWQKTQLGLESHDWGKQDANGRFVPLTEDERRQRLAIEYSALENGGLDATKLNAYRDGLAKAKEAEANGNKGAIKKFYKNNPYRIEDMVARGTVAGNLLFDNANALTQKDEKYRTSWKYNTTYKDKQEKIKKNTADVGHGSNITSNVSYHSLGTKIKEAKESGNIVDYKINITKAKNVMKEKIKKNGGNPNDVFAYIKKKGGEELKKAVKAKGFNITNPKEFDNGIAAMYATGDLSSVPKFKYALRGTTGRFFSTMLGYWTTKAINDSANDNGELASGYVKEIEEEKRIANVFDTYLGGNLFNKDEDMTLVTEGDVIYFGGKSGVAKDADYAVQQMIDKGNTAVPIGSAVSRSRIVFNNGTPSVAFDYRKGSGENEISGTEVIPMEDSGYRNSQLGILYQKLRTTEYLGDVSEVQRTGTSYSANEIGGSLLVGDKLSGGTLKQLAHDGTIINLNDVNDLSPAPIKVENEVIGGQDRYYITTFTGGKKVIISNADGGKYISNKNEILESLGKQYRYNLDTQLLERSTLSKVYKNE